MRWHLCISVLFILSCKAKTEQTTVNNTIPEPKWELKRRVVYSNNLNSEGQPDTAFITKYIYENGVISGISKMQILRRYRNNMLYSQKQYSISENGNYVLTNENFRTYDYKGRPDSFILIKNGIITLKEKHKYDNEDRSLQTISFSNGDEDEEDSSTKGSSLLEGLKTDFIYDPDGKLTETKTTDLNGHLVHKEQYIFNGIEPVFSYLINDKNDTTQTTKFEKDGKFNKETIIIKGGGTVTRWIFLNKLIQLITEFPDGTKTKVFNRYNQRGILTEMKTYISK